MTPNEIQGRYLIERGFLTQAEVAQIWPMALHHRVDLCEVLLRQNRLSPTQAKAVRDDATRRASQRLKPDLTVIVPQADSQALARQGSSHRFPALKQASSSRSFPVLSSAATGAPKELGPYSIVGILSQGGMGIIYRGRHPDLVSDLAIKTVLNGADQILLARFKKEIEALSRVEHENIVKIIGSGEANGCPYLAMELVEGQDLQAYISERENTGEGFLDIDWVCDVFACLAEALHACHEEGLIHRDIKPQNVMLDAFQKPILVDFGIAKVSTIELDRARDDVVSLTKTGQVVGTPAYMAPEQLVPNEEFGGIGPATDVWGLATTMFFALTGQTVVELSGTNFQVALLTAKLPGPQSVRPETPQALEEICQACFIREASERPSMAELAKMLRAVETKPRSKFRSIAFIILLVLVAGAFGLYSLFFQNGEIASLESPKWSNNETFTVTGRLTGPWTGKIEAFQDERWVTIREIDQQKLEFQWTLPLKQEGKHKFRLLAKNGQVSKEWTINFDNTAPELQLNSLENGQVFVSAEQPLSGTISETNLLSLKWNGREVSVDNGRFSIPLFDATEKTEVMLGAIDAAGNKAQLSCLVVTPNAVKTLKKKLADRTLWNSCSEIDQDLIVNRIQAELGQTFQLIDMTVFGSGSQRHRLAMFVHLPTGIEFVLVPGGRFFIGTQSLKKEERYVLSKNPQYQTADLRRETSLKVTVKPMLVSRYETSEEQWHRFSKLSPKDAVMPNHPAKNMTLSEISAWLKWIGDELRLPTEIEWEWAARGSSTSRFPWGDELDSKQVWYGKNADKAPHAIFEHRHFPNAFGLVDVIGNIMEWTSSPFHPNYESLVSKAPPPKAYEPFSTVRGGHHRQGADMLRTAKRQSLNKAARSPMVGFRLVRSIDSFKK
ncbi:MAG: SUMF1/EgtB/PvdO family nonheme iron enzyme [Planctomycetota bacterium]|nr:SUMF1/EgtB/PvdO family nonheme iron enzyme [Planctomycetota bacterium]